MPPLANHPRQTIYNGDRIQGIPVITALNVDDLSEGIHYFMFESVRMNIGQPWYVPVMVAKGALNGPKMLLTSGVHGDELNGSRVIHLLFNELNSSELNGTIIAVPQVCPNSLMHISKNWYLSSDGGDYVNMNRSFPGNSNGNSAEQHAAFLWQRLFAGNSDYLIDLHSQSTDTEYPLFVFADFREPQVKHMALLIPADQIKDDSGENGTLETSFIQAGIPALTIEVGGARCYQDDFIRRAVVGIKNILVDLNMLAGKIKDTATSINCFIGNDMLSIRANTGGYSKILVALGEMVRAGSLVAQQYNQFGQVIADYHTPVAGKVLSLGSGATREAGDLLVRILYQS